MKISMQRTAQKNNGAGIHNEDSVPLKISQCMSRSVQTHTEILYSAIWLRNKEHLKYAYLYNQTQSKFFQKFEDCKRHGLSLIQLNIFKTICNQYRFDAVFIQRQLKAIVSPFKGLRIEEFMKIHGSMPDQVQIRSFITVGGPLPEQKSAMSRIKNTTGMVHDLAMTPQPNRYASVNNKHHQN